MHLIACTEWPLELFTMLIRWEVQAQAELLQHPALSAGPLDLLVLDNTYCHPRLVSLLICITQMLHETSEQLDTAAMYL